MSYPSPPHMAFITAQPKQYDINCNFGMFPGERLIYHNKMNNGCCRVAALGDIYHTSVTDIRYASRRDQCLLFGCCCKRPYLDTTIFFRDIDQLVEIRKGIICCQAFCENCFERYPQICWCRCMIPKRLQLRGSFTKHVVYIYPEDLPDFEYMINEAIAQHKLLDKH